jgi:hypothetical protein
VREYLIGYALFQEEDGEEEEEEEKRRNDNTSSKEIYHTQCVVFVCNRW